MPKPVKADLQKHTLNLRSGDWDEIEAWAKPEGLSTSEVVRILVSNFVDKRRKQLPQVNTSEIDIKLELE